MVMLWSFDFFLSKFVGVGSIPVKVVGRLSLKNIKKNMDSLHNDIKV